MSREPLDVVVPGYHGMPVISPFRTWYACVHGSVLCVCVTLCDAVLGVCAVPHCSPLYRLDPLSSPMAADVVDTNAHVLEVDPISLRFAELFFAPASVSKVATSISGALSASRSTPQLPGLGGSSLSRMLSHYSSMASLPTPSVTGEPKGQHLHTLSATADKERPFTPGWFHSLDATYSTMQQVPRPSTCASASELATTSIPSLPTRVTGKAPDLAKAGLMATGKPPLLYNPLDATYIRTSDVKDTPLYQPPLRAATAAATSRAATACIKTKRKAGVARFAPDSQQDLTTFSEMEAGQSMYSFDVSPKAPVDAPSVTIRRSKPNSATSSSPRRRQSRGSLPSIRSRTQSTHNPGTMTPEQQAFVDAALRWQQDDHPSSPISTGSGTAAYTPSAF